jgi:ATP-binding cassette subfamily F protein uup
VVTSTLVFETDGVIRKYPGGYTDWLRQGKQLEERDNPVTKPQVTTGQDPIRSKRPTKLSYKLKLELESLPQRIEELEAEIRDLHAQTQATEFYTKPYAQVQETLELIRGREGLLDEAMRRWDELEGMQKQLQAGN